MFLNKVSFLCGFREFHLNPNLNLRIFIYLKNYCKTVNMEQIYSTKKPFIFYFMLQQSNVHQYKVKVRNRSEMTCHV